MEILSGGPNGELHLGDSVSHSIRIISRHWRELVGFSLIFLIFEGVVCAPLVALVGKWLLGRTVLDSTAVVAFLLSTRGLLACVFTMTALITLHLVEHAGLSAIFFGAFQRRRVATLEAGRIVWRHLLVLVRVSARFVGIGLPMLLPLLMTAGGFAIWLLPRHDVNYYLKLRPPQFTVAVSVIGLVTLFTAIVAMALLARWRWVVQAVIFEQRWASDAFARSAALSEGVRWKVAGAIIGVALFSLGLGLIASFLGTASASILLRLARQSAASLAISFGILFLLRIILGATCSFLGSWAEAGLFTSLYCGRVAVSCGQPFKFETTDTDSIKQARWLVPSLAFGLLFFAGCSAWLALETFSDVRTISVHAHRGVTTQAPENTLAAVRAAIAAGADYIETDIQLSKDGVLVAAHDSDFSRLAGVAKKVWELTYEEIRAIPLGRNAAPEFRNEVTPTFDALLSEAKGHIKVNIELKYYGDHEPELPRKVVESVRAHQMLDQVVIQSLKYEPLLEVRKLAPEVSVGYLLSFNARQPSRLEVDFLSVEQNRLNGRFVRRAHRRGQQVYAWTVNTVSDMQRQFDFNVDGVITDQSALARKTLDEYQGRPRLERFASQIRAWLTD
jgi:glycerophosphoryl diester phosphodiesterase